MAQSERVRARVRVKVHELVQVNAPADTVCRVLLLVSLVRSYNLLDFPPLRHDRSTAVQKPSPGHSPMSAVVGPPTRTRCPKVTAACLIIVLGTGASSATFSIRAMRAIAADNIAHGGELKYGHQFRQQSYVCSKIIIM